MLFKELQVKLTAHKYYIDELENDITVLEIREKVAELEQGLEDGFIHNGLFNKDRKQLNELKDLLNKLDNLQAHYAQAERLIQKGIACNQDRYAYADAEDAVNAYINLYKKEKRKVVRYAVLSAIMALAVFIASALIDRSIENRREEERRQQSVAQFQTLMEDAMATMPSVQDFSRASRLAAEHLGVTPILTRGVNVLDTENGEIFQIWILAHNPYPDEMYIEAHVHMETELVIYIKADSEPQIQGMAQVLMGRRN